MPHVLCTIHPGLVHRRCRQNRFVPVPVPRVLDAQDAGGTSLLGFPERGRQGRAPSTGILRGDLYVLTLTGLQRRQLYATVEGVIGSAFVVRYAVLPCLLFRFLCCLSLSLFFLRNSGL